VTLFLALWQKLNVYYAAALSAVCWLEAARLAGCAAARLLPQARWPRPAAALLAAGTLAFPMKAGLERELSAVRVPGSEVFAALEWMHRELPRPVAAYDPRLLDSPLSVAELSRASSVLAPWSLGHLLLYVAELPVVGNNFGYGYRDSLRFFLAESEEEALAIARARRSRWVLAADILPSMNDYADALDRRPLLEDSGRGPEPTPAFFRTLQTRLYEFEGQGADLPGVRVEPLSHFRLIYRSKSSLKRGDRWIAQWKVFEITE
ncbi:MAG: hypothetical protein ACRD00_07030, partial [Thermoanaerobaculia bacterium]